MADIAGGLSYLSDLYGLACDNVVNFEVSPGPRSSDSSILADTGAEAADSRVNPTDLQQGCSCRWIDCGCQRGFQLRSLVGAQGRR